MSNWHQGSGAVEIFIMLDCQGKKLHTKEMTPGITALNGTRQGAYFRRRHITLRLATS